MATNIDMKLIKNSRPIHNGSVIVTCSRTGLYSAIEEEALTIPPMSILESKYENRFDDPSYYFGGGGGNVDGGFYGAPDGPDVLGV